jgi:ABC-type sugar transport system substrate-binding protein
MKSLWAAGTATVMSLALGGLPVLGQESSEAPSDAPGPAQAGPTIGFTNFYQDGGFFSAIELGAREAAAAAGAELIAVNAWATPATQTGQVADFIEAGVDVIIIVPVDPDSIVGAVEFANAEGIPVLAVDRTANGGMVSAIIASDNVAAGRMAGEALFAAMGGSGAVIEIQGDMGVSSGSLRSEGFAEALAAAPGITLAVQVPASWDYDAATRGTLEALEADTGISGVFASNLDMLHGAVHGVAAADRPGRVRVAGVDTDADILEMVRDGTIDATVAQQPRLMGQRAVEAAIALAAGATVEAFIPVETVLVTADTVEAFMADTMATSEPASG